MAFREVGVHEVREVLRHWLGEEIGLRLIAERAGVDRKTARRYVEAAVAAGLVREGGEAQLTDELIGVVVQAVRPERPQGHGVAWVALLAHEGQIRDWITDELQLTNIHGKLARRGCDGAVSHAAPFRGRAVRVRSAAGHGARRGWQTGGGVPTGFRPPRHDG